MLGIYPCVPGMWGEANLYYYIWNTPKYIGKIKEF